jgi:hypothetical protein
MCTSGRRCNAATRCAVTVSSIPRLLIWESRTHTACTSLRGSGGRRGSWCKDTTSPLLAMQSWDGWRHPFLKPSKTMPTWARVLRLLLQLYYLEHMSLIAFSTERYDGMDDGLLDAVPCGCPDICTHLLCTCVCTNAACTCVHVVLVSACTKLTACMCICTYFTHIRAVAWMYVCMSVCMLYECTYDCMNERSGTLQTSLDQAQQNRYYPWHYNTSKGLLVRGLGLNSTSTCVVYRNVPVKFVPTY